MIFLKVHKKDIYHGVMFLRDIYIYDTKEENHVLFKNEEFLDNVVLINNKRKAKKFNLKPPKKNHFHIQLKDDDEHYVLDIPVDDASWCKSTNTHLVATKLGRLLEKFVRKMKHMDKK